MFKHTRAIAALAFALFIPLAGCGDATDNQFGSVSVLLTDAPGDEVVEAWVTITDIYLQGSTGDEDPENGRVYLLQDAENETHELLSLAETVEELVRDQEVPTGTYGQLRIVMSDGCIVTDDGGVFSSSAGYAECGPATGSLQMPSFTETGAKVLLNGLTIEGGQQILLLDFNVEESFGRVAGASGMWVMTPVIHASEIELTVGVEATLDTGEVSLPDGYELGQFSATLVAPGSDDSTLMFEPDEDGTFVVEFRYLVPQSGPFDIHLNAPEGLTVTSDPTSPQEGLAPASGEVASVNWVLQTAEEEDTAG